MSVRGRILESFRVCFVVLLLIVWRGRVELVILCFYLSKVFYGDKEDCLFLQFVFSKVSFLILFFYEGG